MSWWSKLTKPIRDRLEERHYRQAHNGHCDLEHCITCQAFNADEPFRSGSNQPVLPDGVVDDGKFLMPSALLMPRRTKNGILEPTCPDCGQPYHPPSPCGLER